MNNKIYVINNQNYLCDNKNFETDSILCVWWSWELNLPGIVKVLASDSNYYLLTESSYRKASEKKISFCDIITKLVSAA